MEDKLIEERVARSERAIENILNDFHERYGIGIDGDDAEDFYEEFEYNNDKLYFYVFENGNGNILCHSGHVPWGE